MADKDGQASAQEDIEITPKMMDAGQFELFNYDPDMETGTEFLTRVYRAMELAKAVR